MRGTKRILHVAAVDLRLMVGDKIFFFWTLAFPIMFIVLFGFLYKSSDNAPDVAELTVVNLDQGRWGAYFIGKIETPGIAVTVTDKEPAEYGRLIVLPPDFSAKIEARIGQKPGLQEARGRVVAGGRARRDPALSSHRPDDQRAHPLRRGRPRQVPGRPPGVP